MVSKTGKTVWLIYCHWDGYPSNNGRILLEHYQDETKVKKLIHLGDLSFLGPEIGKKHNFNKAHDEHPDWCCAYGRDRRAKKTHSVQYRKSNFQSWNELCQQEYLYLWKDGQWWFTDGKINLIPLTMEICQDN